VKEEKEKAVSGTVAGSGVSGAVAVKEPRKKGNSAQLYGVAGSLPDKSIVEQMVVAYLDTLYKA